MKYTYKYPRPALTVDAAIFQKKAGEVHILLIQRKNDPFAGLWALPGGFVNEDETLEEAIKRELVEETNINCNKLIQFKAYSAIDRDPRHRTISIVFYYNGGSENDFSSLKAGDDAAQARWFSLNNLAELAFDHTKIVKELVEILYKDSR